MYIYMCILPFLPLHLCADDAADALPAVDADTTTDGRSGFHRVGVSRSHRKPLNS